MSDQAHSAAYNNSFWTRFRTHRLALISFFAIVALMVLSLAAPVIEMALDLNAEEANLFHRLKPVSSEHWLGTDEVGRDVFLRLLYGGRVSLLVGIVAALLAAVIGTTVGLISGYFGGLTDSLCMRATDTVIALPLLPLLIVLSAVDPSKLGLPDALTNSGNFNLYQIILIISLVGWTTVARLVRAETLSLRNREFVVAARARGIAPWIILFRHILPNVASPIVVATTLTIGSVILFESILSFLSLGIQPPTPSWGNMLNTVQDYIWDAPLLAVWPGLMIFVTVIAFNFLGDGLQDALDPKSGQK